jgi:hypothetical protein
MKRANEQKLLLERFVSSFRKHDEMSFFPELDPIALQLAIGLPDKLGLWRWQPKKVATDSSQLDVLYEKLPARLPPLFEQLVLSYRWAEVDLGSYRLLANPPGADLSGLLYEISKDPAIWSALRQNGYMRFAKGHDMDYDPVCFDISAPKKNGEYEIVKIDHEEILCNSRIKVIKKMAPTFRELVLQTISNS